MLERTLKAAIHSLYMETLKPETGPGLFRVSAVAPIGWEQRTTATGSCERPYLWMLRLLPGAAAVVADEELLEPRGGEENHLLLWERIGTLQTTVEGALRLSNF
ncbi:hypothetical protein UY3_13954 [Chelonia mydas]|uniref:Uncharacterized protein n=1 Tax=Chelonia mydas TaxID=8469 RepID=M7B0K0_CHEMY|nr:hypothetical protein UY3_13954 [Chelonia mydas]